MFPISPPKASRTPARTIRRWARWSPPADSSSPAPATGRSAPSTSSNGKLLWETEVTAALEGIPAVYEVGGRQYIVFCAAAQVGLTPATQVKIPGPTSRSRCRSRLLPMLRRVILLLAIGTVGWSQYASGLIQAQVYGSGNPRPEGSVRRETSGRDYRTRQAHPPTTAALCDLAGPQSGDRRDRRERSQDGPADCGHDPRRPAARADRQSRRRLAESRRTGPLSSRPRPGEQPALHRRLWPNSSRRIASAPQPGSG